MKKPLILLLLLNAFSLSLFAARADIHISYTPSDQTVCAKLSITEGNAIVGHFGLTYNTQKLQLVTVDKKTLPEPLPEAGENGKGFLTSIVEPGSSHIVITAESGKTSSLVVPSEGMVLFGWYASKSIAAVTPDTDHGLVARIYFRLYDGVSPDDLSEIDITPVLSEQCSSLSGWKNGMMLIDSDSTVYTYEAREGAESLPVSVLLDEKADAVIDDTYDNANIDDEQISDSPEDTTRPQPEESLPDESTMPDTDMPMPDASTDEENSQEENVYEPDPDYDSALPELGEPLESGYFGLSAHTYSDKIRFLWDVPHNKHISHYSLTISDLEGNTVRQINNLVGITRSVTIGKLAPDFALLAQLTAYTIDEEGTNGAEMDTLLTQTKKTSSAGLLVYTISYEPGIGELYGFESEDVLFGEKPVKLPTVYPPDGYAFAGWSFDGETVLDIDTLCIYEDCILTAVFEATEQE